MASQTNIILANNRLPYFILAEIIIAFTVGMSKGFYFYSTQIWLLMISWLILLLPLIEGKKFYFKLDLKPINLLLWANFFSFIVFYFFDGPLYISLKQLYFINIFKLLSVIFFSLYFFEIFTRSKILNSSLIKHFTKNKFIYLIILAIFLRFLTLLLSPAPTIDVFYFTQGGAESMLKGLNPYNGIFKNIYSPEVNFMLYQDYHWQNSIYSYWPATIIFTTFFDFLFGEVRLTYLFADLACALIIYFLLKKVFSLSGKISELATLLFLYSPLTLLVLESSWSEPLAIFLLYLAVFLIILGYKYLPYFIFGIFFAVKQTMLVILFFLLRFRGINHKKYLLTLIIFILILFPFLIWDFQNFINDTVIHHIKFAGNVALHALSFNTIYKMIFTHDIPVYIFIPSMMILALFLFWRGQRDLIGIIHSSLILLLAAFFIKQGFTNYYYSVLAILILLIILALKDRGLRGKEIINENR